MRPTDELNESEYGRRLSQALGVRRAPTERFSAGFLAFQSTPVHNLDELVALGFACEPMEAPPALYLGPKSDTTIFEQQWQRCRAFFGKNAPEIVEHHLEEPAWTEDVVHVEAILGTALPDDFRAWLAKHDGTRHPAPFRWELGTLVESLNHKRSLDAARQELSEVDEGIVSSRGVRAQYWNASWFPFASSGAGDHLCLDLDPAESGTHGQVIEFQHDTEHRTFIAPSFAHWLGLQCDAFERGSQVILEREGKYDGVLQGVDLTGSLVAYHVRGESVADRLQRIQAHYSAEPGSLAVNLIQHLRRASLLSGYRENQREIFTAVVSAVPGTGKQILSSLLYAQNKQPENNTPKWHVAASVTQIDDAMQRLMAGE